MLVTLKVAQTAGLQFSPDLPCHARNKIPAILWFRDLSCQLLSHSQEFRGTKPHTLALLKASLVAS